MGRRIEGLEFRLFTVWDLGQRNAKDKGLNSFQPVIVV